MSRQLARSVITLAALVGPFTMRKEGYSSAFLTKTRINIAIRSAACQNDLVLLAAINRCMAHKKQTDSEPFKLVNYSELQEVSNENKFTSTDN